LDLGNISDKEILDNINIDEIRITDDNNVKIDMNDLNSLSEIEKKEKSKTQKNLDKKNIINKKPEELNLDIEI
jgi:hypothetical protein